MCFFLSNKYKVSSHCIWYLIAFSGHFNWVIIWCSFINRNFYNFFFLNNLSPITSFTFPTLADNLALALTLITVFLNLLIHSRTHLEHLNYSPLTFACFTFLNILSSFACTFLTASCSFVRDF